MGSETQLPVFIFQSLQNRRFSDERGKNPLPFLMCGRIAAVQLRQVYASWSCLEHLLCKYEYENTETKLPVGTHERANEGVRENC